MQFGAFLVVIGFWVQRVAGLHLLMTPYAKDLQLSAHLGLSPDVLLEDPEGFRAKVSQVALAAAGSVPAEYVELPIDHNDSSIGTFMNRYWVNTDAYSSGGPVLLYDVGEADASYTAASFLTDNTTFFMQMLAEFSAVGIVWEHRYYGDSLPYPVNAKTTPEQLQYLTIDQALADLPLFASRFKRSEFPQEDLTPQATPWVMIGGSYAGMRAAFMREFYPDTIFASFASSAPVEVSVDMSVYFEPIYRGMNAYGYGNCSKDWHAALSYIDSQLADQDSAAAIKQLFFGPGAEQNSNGGFARALAGILALFQAFGMGAGSTGIGALCDWLETSTDANGTVNVAGPDGFAPVLGDKYVAERWAAWPIYTELVNYNYHTNCRGLNASQPLSCMLGKTHQNPDFISYTWQSCSQLGFFQSDNIGPHALLSRYLSEQYLQDFCYRQFPAGLSSGFLPKTPQARLVNRQTGGWYMRPSNVYWSGGEFDPWRTLSPLSTQEFAPRVEFTTDIPACGVQTGENTLFGYIMPDAEHGFDLYTTLPIGAVSRGFFISALKKWLPCFGKH